MARRWEDRGLTIIAVPSIPALDAATAGWREKFWSGRDLPYRVAADGPGRLHGAGVNIGGTHDAYHVTGWPTAVLVGRDGRVAHVFRAELSSELMEPLFETDAKDAG